MPRVQALLLIIMTPLIYYHFWLVGRNLTTRENLQWHRSVQAAGWRSAPSPGSVEWASYAPYDRGIVRNVLAFLSGRRDELRNASVQPQQTAKDAAAFFADLI